MKNSAHNLPKNVPNVIDQYLIKTKTAYENKNVVDAYWERTKTLQYKDDFNKMIQYIGVGGKLLDLGCGPGRDSAYFAQNGLNVLGVDYSSQMLHKAKELHQNIPNLSFILMDMRNLTFTDASFDGIWACASLLHLPKKELPTVLKGIYRILKPGGILYVRVLKGVGEKVLTETKYTKPIERFFSFFGSSQIQKYLIKAGFTILSSDIKASTSRPTVWFNIFCKKE